MMGCSNARARQPNGHLFLLLNLAVPTPMLHIALIELWPNDLASTRPCVGLTTFLQISNEPAALVRGFVYTFSEGRVLWRKEP
jgi:hypothetical protein